MDNIETHNELVDYLTREEGWYVYFNGVEVFTLVAIQPVTPTATALLEKFHWVVAASTQEGEHAIATPPDHAFIVPVHLEAVELGDNLGIYSLGDVYDVPATRTWFSTHGYMRVAVDEENIFYVHKDSPIDAVKEHLPKAAIRVYQDVFMEEVIAQLRQVGVMMSGRTKFDPTNDLCQEIQKLAGY